MLRCAIVLEVALAMTAFSAPVVQAAPSEQMPTVQAINVCRAELGGNTIWL
jgi:hypothetical protein